MTGVLVHEWIEQSGGSENVLRAFADLFPDAPVVCLWNDSVGRFEPERLRESWLARTPLRRSKALALPLMPLTWQNRRDDDYDWALISSHAFAHHARFRGAGDDFRRMVYVHTPARYVWTPTLDARGDNMAARTMSKVLRAVDRRQARRGAEFAANSSYVADRVRAAWGVEPRVIYPPVDVEKIQQVDDWSRLLPEVEADVLDSLPDGFVLGASRFVPYKRLDLVIRAGEATGRPVVLAGRGPLRLELELLGRQATVPVQIVDAPSTEMLYALYSRAAVFAFPAIEDFGIMPVEAAAAGAPILARNEGGAAESTLHEVTGALSPFSDPSEIREAVELAMETSRAVRRDHARRFGASRFSEEIRGWVAEA